MPAPTIADLPLDDRSRSEILTDEALAFLAGADLATPIVMPRQDPVADCSFDEDEGTVLHDDTGDGNEETSKAARPRCPASTGTHSAASKIQANRPRA